MSNTNLYPLKFAPQLKEKVWGGSKLATIFGKGNAANIGESWELSAVKGSISSVSNGDFSGLSLQALIDQHQANLVGTRVWQQFGNEFPLLFKFIDAKEDLSVQVHPNDIIAKNRHDSFGKTEMWYVIDAEPNARLIVGFENEPSKETYLEHLAKGTLLNILNEQPVSKGDGFYISPGTVHAIGGGILLAEIQQTSDITYRIYDWNRPDAYGKLRPLHTEEAIDVIDFNPTTSKLVYSSEENTKNLLCNSRYFETSVLQLTKPFLCAYNNTDSFTVLMCTEGDAILKTKKHTTVIKTGETVLVPAIFKEIKIETAGATILQVRVP